jgi:hypothetical protein
LYERLPELSKEPQFLTLRVLGARPVTTKRAIQHPELGGNRAFNPRYEKRRLLWHCLGDCHD